jgi:hypothetical protein
MEFSGKGVADDICKEHPEFKPLHGLISMKADNLGREMDDIMSRISKAIQGCDSTSMSLTMITMLAICIKAHIKDPIQREAVISSLGELYNELRQEFPDATQSETTTTT